MYVWMDGWMDGRMDGWMDGWMDVRMDVCMLTHIIIYMFILCQHQNGHRQLCNLNAIHPCSKSGALEGLVALSKLYVLGPLTGGPDVTCRF